MTDLPYGGDPFEEPVDHPLLGRRVRVVMARTGDCPSGHQHSFDDNLLCLPLAQDEYIVGTLVRLDAGGGFDIRRDIDGKMRYCWPALDIAEEIR